MKLVSVAEMQAIEKEADARGLSYAQMMEHAGTNLAKLIVRRFGDETGKQILALVGSGNNGGDALVCLAYLALQGWVVTGYLVKERAAQDPLVQRVIDTGGRIVWREDDQDGQLLSLLLNQADLLLDGVFGTGVKLPLRGEAGEILKLVRQELLALETPPLVIAVDCPSGVDCDSGQVAEETIPADITVTMAAVKQGLLKFPAFESLGDLELVGIGLPEGGEGYESLQKLQRAVASSEMLRQYLPARSRQAHKGTFGTALIVAGSRNYTGAASLAGEAAYRSGAGLVTLAVPASLHAALAGRLPEVTWLQLPEQDGFIAAEGAEVVLQALERPTALLMGPGFGQSDSTLQFLKGLLGVGPERGRGKMGFGQPEPKEQTSRSQLPPLVIDADGLKLLTKIADWPQILPQDSILTPHPGEMSILTGETTAAIQEDRLAVAEKYAQAWGQVVVLKGAFTVIAAPDGRTVVIPVATPALARAGTGDVLAGLITGLRAQGVSAFWAAVLGCWLHAQCGLAAAQQHGNTATVLAGDVLSALPAVMREFSRKSNKK